jgi:hypothetical protein
LAVVDDGAGGVWIRGRGSAEDGAVVRAALLPLTKPAPATDPDDPTCAAETDPRDHGARMWDALVQLAQHGLDTDVAPESHGARPRLSVLVDLDTLEAGLDRHACIDEAGNHASARSVFARPPHVRDPVTDDGLTLSAAAVRRLACDADLIPVVLGTDGEVLDLGHTRRLVSAAQWRALVARDRQCAFPGCTRPPVMGHAHHIIHWADGGPTDLNNLVLLCGEHHRILHHTPWQVRINPDDHLPEFLPPSRGASETTEWIRHRPRRE